MWSRGLALTKVPTSLRQNFETSVSKKVSRIFVVPGEPLLNPKAKRFIKTITDISRTILIHSNLPARVYPGAFNHSIWSRTKPPVQENPISEDHQERKHSIFEISKMAQVIPAKNVLEVQTKYNFQRIFCKNVIPANLPKDVLEGSQLIQALIHQRTAFKIRLAGIFDRYDKNLIQRCRQKKVITKESNRNLRDSNANFILLEFGQQATIPLIHSNLNSGIPISQSRLQLRLRWFKAIRSLTPKKPPQSSPFGREMGTEKLPGRSCSQLQDQEEYMKILRSGFVINQTSTTSLRLSQTNEKNLKAYFLQATILTLDQMRQASPNSAFSSSKQILV